MGKGVWALLLALLTAGCATNEPEKIGYIAEDGSFVYYANRAQPTKQPREDSPLEMLGKALEPKPTVMRPMKTTCTRWGNQVQCRTEPD